MQREAELTDNSAFFRDIVAEGARLFRCSEFGQDPQQLRDSARSIVRYLIVQSRLAPVVLQIQHELVDEHKVLEKTAAGIILTGELHKADKDYEQQLAGLQKDMENTIQEQGNNRKAEIADLHDEFRRKMKITEREHKVLESSMADLQAREKQTLLDKLDATERRFQMLLKRSEDDLRDMEESLQLMKKERVLPSSAARSSSADGQKIKQELVEHENEVADMSQKVNKDKIAFDKLRETTRSTRQGIISGVAGSRKRDNSCSDWRYVVFLPIQQGCGWHSTTNIFYPPSPRCSSVRGSIGIGDSIWETRWLADRITI